MTPSNLPPHIARQLGKPQMAAQCAAIVAAAEAHGARIRVRRLQLGDWRAPGFGEWRTVYTTQKREADRNPLPK